MSFIYADAVSHRIVDVADRKLKSLKSFLSLFFETKTKSQNSND